MNSKFGALAITVSLLIIFASSVSHVQSQSRIDVSKITCEDFVFYKVSNPNTIVHWLSGYYHGKLNDPIVDPQMFEENVKKLRDYCEQTKNYKVTLMQVIEQTLAGSK